MVWIIREVFGGCFQANIQSNTRPPDVCLWYWYGWDSICGFIVDNYMAHDGKPFGTKKHTLKRQLEFVRHETSKVPWEVYMRMEGEGGILSL